MKTPLLFLIQFVFVFQLFGQEVDQPSELDPSTIVVYETTRDFKDNIVYEGDYSIEIVENKEHYLKIILKRKNRRDKLKHFGAWALKIGDDIYFNTSYIKSGAVRNNKPFKTVVFTKFDVVGDICATVLDKRYPKASAGYYGYGLTGLLTTAVVNEQMTWRTKNFEQVKIMVAIVQEPAFHESTDCSHARLMTRQELKKMFENHPELAENFKGNKILAEDVLNVLELYNTKKRLEREGR